MQFIQLKKKIIPEQMRREELIKYVKATEDIKKINGLPKTAKEKYKIINIIKDIYNINLLCLILKCSRSGHYSWINLGRSTHKSYDKSISNVIFEQYSKDNRQGIRRLRMNTKKIYGIELTNSTIYRYMQILNISSIIRKRKKKYTKLEHHKIPNLIKRDS